MPWREPAYEGEFPTLGWSLLDLYSEYLRVPSGESYGKPFELTDEQAQFMLRLYAIHPVTGRRLFRRGSLRRMKGWGKSPVAAAWMFGEFTGDVVFDGWDAFGEPVGRPWDTPWIQTAAVSEDQTDNTYIALYEMLSVSPAIDEFDIDLGQTRIFKKGRPGSRIEPVTASAGSREGQPVTAAHEDESHLWTPTNGGRKLDATLSRNVAKMGGSVLETTNAYSPGDGTVAEETDKSHKKGAAGLLYDSIEAPMVDDLRDREAVKAALTIARGDARWVDLERIADECADPRNDPADMLRFYFNRITKASGRAIDPRRWAELARPDIFVPDGAYIGVGFDGSQSNDSTAIYGFTKDGHGFLIAAWERPPGAPAGWSVPRIDVGIAVGDVFARYKVGQMYCDPPLWRTEIEQWQEQYRPNGEDVVLALDTYSPTRFAPVCEAFTTAVRVGSITHDGDMRVAQSIANMARQNVRPNADLEDARTRFTFTKSGTGKIDIGVAAALAYSAMIEMPAEVHKRGPSAFYAGDSGLPDHLQWARFPN